MTRFGPRGPLLAGLVSCGLGLVLLTEAAGSHTTYVSIVLPAFVLFGIGAGLAFMPLLTIAMEHVPAADAGMASGIVNTSLQLSAALGVAVLGTVATDRSRTLASHGEDSTSALLGGYHLAFTIGAVAVALAVAVTLLLLGRPRTPRHAAEPAAPPAEAVASEVLVEAEAA